MNKKHFFIPLILQPSLVKCQSLWLGGVSYVPKTGEASFHFSEPEALAQIKKYFPKLKPKIFLLVIHSVAEKFPEVEFPKSLTPVAFQNFIFEKLLSADDDSLQFGDVEFIAPEEVEKAVEVQFRTEGIPNRLMRDPQRLGKIYYHRFPTFKTREQKLTALRIVRLEGLEFELITPDKQGNWLDLTDNDFEELLPLCSKAVKAGKSEEAVFKLFSLGVSTNRDDWNFDFNLTDLEKKASFFCSFYEDEKERWNKNDKSIKSNDFVDRTIKWTEELEKHMIKGSELKYNKKNKRKTQYRPFVTKWQYYDKIITHRLYQMPQVFGLGCDFYDNKLIALAIGGRINFCALAVSRLLPNQFYVDPAQCLPLYRYNSEGQRLDNITDWGLKQFRARYSGDGGRDSGDSSRGMGASERGAESRILTPAPQSPPTESRILTPAPQSPPTESRTPNPESQPPITKEDIFHYVYAVLHNPAYREKYKINLKRDFPRIPFYNDFWQWANWGKTLMDLHLNYEEAEEFPLERIESGKPKEFPKVKLRRDKKQPDQIVLDENTTLAGIPEAAWEYKLGNRSALEWVLDQYKEKNPRDETIREKFNTYRFADYKEEVIVLIKKVCTVSLRTVEVVGEM